ncbi:MAG: SRPBCC domain-containing protein [Vicingaceae bacterium]
MESFELKCVFPVSASKLTEAWLSSEEHSAFTGGMAAIEPRVGSRFTAWDGYITGEILQIDQGRILFNWRTTEFPEGAENSILELLIRDVENGCELSLIHSNIPDGQGSNYKSGWEDHYFEPMRAYFKAD